MSVIKKLMMTAAGGAELLAIEDVFSTYLYTGNGSTQTITNGIDLAGEGGLVWIKVRNVGDSHALLDTERGAGFELWSNSTNGNINASAKNFSFLGTGFSMNTADGQYNNSSNTYASWTFRKAPRFFDVVTYTGDGSSSRFISHNLGVTPGAIFFKRLNSTSNWRVFHRYNDSTSLRLNDTSSRYNNLVSLWSNTDTVFEVMKGENELEDDTNINGATYVAYLFAHDPLGPSGDGSDGLIACNSYTGNGSSTGPVISLGWEPQWLLVRRAGSSASGNWNIIDNMRGFVAGGTDTELRANSANGETTSTVVSPTATGFQLNTTNADYNASGGTYIYIAIRRGPMREPTSGTEVFTPVSRGNGVSSTSSGFVTDLIITKGKSGGEGEGGSAVVADRLRGSPYLQTASTAAETTSTAVFPSNPWDIQDGVDLSGTVSFLTNGFGTLYVDWMFRRAPGFFDVVAYTGDGVAGRTLSHNLGVAPELMIVKQRNAVRDWVVQTAANNFASAGYLQSTSNFAFSASLYSPTATTFTASGDTRDNASGGLYIVYLFATLAGVSKVGSYTGNGSSQTIDCGFTSGARFILIKRTNSTGDWYVWDTARGIVSGNDPHLSLNTTATEVTTNDTIDPDSSGFIVNQVAATNVNVSSANYIYLAIA
jgi:hypothetical protein